MMRKQPVGSARQMWGIGRRVKSRSAQSVNACLPTFTPPGTCTAAHKLPAQAELAAAAAGSAWRGRRSTAASPRRRGISRIGGSQRLQWPCALPADRRTAYCAR